MQLALKTRVTLSPIQAIRSKLNQNSTRFACSHFPVLPKSYMYLLGVLIGTVDCLQPL